MASFMAGAMTTGARVAMTVVVSISSAIPFAILPITLAVQGAIRKQSAFRAREICSTFQTAGSLNMSRVTRFRDRVLRVCSVMKVSAFLVMITSTLA